MCFFIIDGHGSLSMITYRTTPHAWRSSRYSHAIRVHDVWAARSRSVWFRLNTNDTQ